MSINFLNQITLKTQERLAKVSKPLDSLKKEVITARTPHSFLEPFQSRNVPTPIIAEVKFASPSQGIIAKGNPVDIAKQYIKNGASALSILTEPDYFHGSLNYLSEIREAIPEARLLMKDFILDEYQLYQARIFGADAVLLIVALLNPSRLQTLYTKAMELNLTPLVEVHSYEELEIAESIGAKFIGVNNRNLKSLAVDLNTSLQLIKEASSNAILISESGIKSGSDLVTLQNAGFQGFLIGTEFMRQSQPGLALGQLISEAQNAS